MNRQIPFVHRGVILFEEWLKPLGLTQYQLARDINVEPGRINAICKRCAVHF